PGTPNARLFSGTYLPRIRFVPRTAQSARRRGGCYDLILPRKITAQRFLHHLFERHVMTGGKTAAIFELRRGIANHAVKAAKLDPNLAPRRGHGDVLPLERKP